MRWPRECAINGTVDHLALHCVELDGGRHLACAPLGETLPHHTLSTASSPPACQSDLHAVLTRSSISSRAALPSSKRQQCRVTERICMLTLSSEHFGLMPQRRP